MTTIIKSNIGLRLELCYYDLLKKEFIMKHLVTIITVFIGVISFGQGMDHQNNGGFVAAAICFSTLTYIMPQDNDIDSEKCKEMPGQ